MAGNKLTGAERAKTPKLNMLNKDPVSKSILGMLTPEDNKEKTKQGGNNANKSQISKSTLDRISKITSTTIDANHELMESVPGAFKALSILQAAILSPRDLTTINLTYASQPYEGRNNDLNNLLMNKVEDYVENNYKITDRLQDIVANILFYKGSNPIALLSSSALDNVINGHVRASMEAIEDEYKDGHFINRGWLGDNDKTIAAGGRRTASLESLISGEVPPMSSDIVVDKSYEITVTDNDSILRLPQLKLTLARNAMATKVRVPGGLRGRRTTGYGIESLTDKNPAKDKGDNRGDTAISKQMSEEQYVSIYNQLFKTRDYVPSELIEIRRDDELSKQNVDSVLWVDLPPESVVPIHLPGNPKARIGAYVLLDGDGNPLSTAMSENAYQDIQQNKSDTANAIDGTKGIIEMAQEYRNGNSDSFSLTEFRRKVNEEIERDLVQRIANGTFAQKVALGMTDDIKSMMAARTFRNLKTKILFLPEESLVYMAFDYNRFGIGRSLLERSKLYASMAMANVIATTMANISASSNLTTLGIQLDPDNPEPDATVEAIVTTHLNSNRTMSSMIGARNPRDVINIMDEASVMVKTSGHPGYPDIDVDVTYDKRNITPPDADWNDRLLEMLWNMWGVDPALLSTQNATQFAIEHINNNALFRKSTGMQRHMLCAFLSELVQKVVAKSGNLMDDLYQIIRDNKKLWQPTSKKGKEQLKELKEEHPEIDNNDQSLMNFILVNFINSIALTLPEPMEGDIDEQNRAYDTMRQRYENTIKDLYTDDLLSYMLGDSADTAKFEMWRQNLVAHKMREWMAGSGSYNDITELCEVGGDTNAAFTLLASMVAYNEQAAKGLIEYLKLSNKLKGDLKDAFDKLEADGNLENNPADNGFGNSGEGDVQYDEDGNPIGGEGTTGEGDGFDTTDPGAGGDSGDFSAEGDGFSGEGGETDAGANATGAEGEAGDEAASVMSTDAPELDEEGNPAEPALDENGEPVEPTAEEHELDDEGNPIEPPVENEPELDEEGNPVAPAEPVEPEAFSETPIDGADAEFKEEAADGANGEFEEQTGDGGGNDFEEQTADGTPNEFEEPQLDENGEPTEATTEDEENNEGGENTDAVPPVEEEEETPPEFTEPPVDGQEAEFNEPPADGHDGAFEEPKADGVDAEFEEEQHDDGSVKFEETSDGNDDLDFEEDGDDKPTGRDRKSKRAQKKEAKKKKEADKASDDGLDFGKL